jgi:AmmeMemoRadiSam system protein B
MLGAAVRWTTDAGRIVLVASSDFAHYPRAAVARAVTSRLLVPIAKLDGTALLAEERALLASAERGLVCGMCGAQAASLSLAALSAAGATGSVTLGAATSADSAFGGTERTVGYAAVAFLRGGQPA